ncbi:MAG: hypothetical protein WCF07_13050 [Nitrososphaeraceae archaeon]
MPPPDRIDNDGNLLTELEDTVDCPTTTPLPTVSIPLAALDTTAPTPPLLNNDSHYLHISI